MLSKFFKLKKSHHQITTMLKPTKQVIEFNAIHGFVKEFHQKFGHDYDKDGISPEVLLLRSNLIKEESGEGISSLVGEKIDVDAYLDALGDTAYVVAGFAVLLKDAKLAVQNYINVSHDFASLCISERNVDTLAQPFVYATSLAESLNTAYKIISMSNANGERIELQEKVIDALMTNAVIHAGMFFGSASYILASNGLDLEQLVKVIHESNMSKLWSPDAEVRKDQVKRSKYKKSDIGFRCVANDAWVGVRVSDDKVLKSPDYTPVNLSSFVEIFSQSNLVKGE